MKSAFKIFKFLAPVAQFFEYKVNNNEYGI